MKNISQIKQNLDLIEIDDRKIYLVGTAHVSKTSADLVEETIREYKPDSICLELCSPRLDSLKNPDRWRETDIFEVVRSGRSHLLFTQLLLSSFQKRLAQKFGIKPGEEMHRALSVANETGTDIEVIDREIRTTLKRAWANLGLWTLLKLFFSFIFSVFSPEEISEKDIEELKEGDSLLSILEEFADFMPEVKEVLIDERDKYMAEKLRTTVGPTIVAVVGAGHCKGIKEIIGESIDLEAIDEIPPRSKTVLAIAWGIPLIIIGMFIYGFLFSDAETSLSMIAAWVLANGLLSALGAAIALAHPLTILTAFVAAPITSLNPTIAAGWVCGLVEAVIHKPRVRDLETIADDVSTFRGFWSNRVSKILLVVMLANLGSVVGTFVGGFKIASLLQGAV